MPLNIQEHKNKLLQILKDIYSDTNISPFLGFKGGTAAYIFYDLPRFSVDLDFDLLDKSKEDIIFVTVQEIIKGYGRLKEARKKRFNLFYLLSYKDEARNVKIEINRRADSAHYELKTYLGISMLVMDKEDMATNKLMAMYERIGKANRDIFDVWFFLKNNWPINKEIITNRIGMPFKDFLQASITALEKMSNRETLSGMGELLDNKQKSWVRTNLKNDTLFLLKLQLENESGNQ